MEEVNIFDPFSFVSFSITATISSKPSMPSCNLESMTLWITNFWKPVEGRNITLQYNDDKGEHVSVKNSYLSDLFMLRMKANTNTTNLSFACGPVYSINYIVSFVNQGQNISMVACFIHYIIFVSPVCEYYIFITLL